MELFLLFLFAGVVLLVALLVRQQIRFQADLSGGVTPACLAAVKKQLAADEQLLAVVSTANALDHELGTMSWALPLSAITGYTMGLTYRRIVLAQPKNGGWETIELCHITSYGLAGKTLRITTVGGGTRSFLLAHDGTRSGFVSQFTALLQRQSAAAAMGGAGTELAKLAALVQQGAISQADFDRAKGMLLGKPASKIQETTDLLESLYALKRSGVLSEGEFNLKKWDVLSK